MRRKPLLGLVIGLVLIALLAVVLLPLVFPWTTLNCWTESIDIGCGRYRYERYVCFIRWIDRTDETPLSRLHQTLVGCSSEPVWRRVNTFSPGMRTSPHYKHHGSLQAAKILTDAFERATFRADAQTQAIETFLRLLQEDDAYFRADRYAIGVSELALESNIECEVLPSALPDLPQRD